MCRMRRPFAAIPCGSGASRGSADRWRCFRRERRASSRATRGKPHRSQSAHQTARRWRFVRCPPSRMPLESRSHPLSYAPPWLLAFSGFGKYLPIIPWGVRGRHLASSIRTAPTTRCRAALSLLADTGQYQYLLDSISVVVLWWRPGVGIPARSSRAHGGHMCKEDPCRMSCTNR
jgi:hypothetical protein